MLKPVFLLSALYCSVCFQVLENVMHIYEQNCHPFWFTCLSNVSPAFQLNAGAL